MRPGPGRTRRAILRNEEHDAALGEHHLAAIPLLDQDAVGRLQDAYWELVPPGGSGICLDYLRTDRALVERLDALAREHLEERVLDLFHEHRPAYFSFVLKHPGENSALFLHRDLAVDDERYHRTYAMWMPLVDTSPELDNGPLAFVPGSHEIRHGGFGPNATVLFDPYHAHLRGLLEPMSVAAGTALVYDARMLHASEPNRTPYPRLALGCLLAHRDRGPTQVVATGRRHRVVHRVDDRYFVTTAPGQDAADRLGLEYTVIDEYDEEPAVSTEQVLGERLARGGAIREVLVPNDLVDVIGAHTPMPTFDGPWFPGHDHDLELAPDRLPPTSEDAGGFRTLAEPVGAVRCAPHEYDLPPALGDAVRVLCDDVSCDAWVIVVGAGGRVEVDGSNQADVTVVECTPVRSGIGAPGCASELDLGRRVHLPADRRSIIWNDAPGDAIVVLRRPRRSVRTGLTGALWARQPRARATNHGAGAR